MAVLRANEIPAAVSQTGGTFVCDHVFYVLMHALRGGFIHVPFLPKQAAKGQPGLPLETMVEAIAVAIEVSLKTRRDVRVAGGRAT